MEEKKDFIFIISLGGLMCSDTTAGDTSLRSPEPKSGERCNRHELAQGGECKVKAASTGRANG